MKYKLKHKTIYRYFEPVNTYHSVVCLEPLNNEVQVCEKFDLLISPSIPAELVNRRKDFYGNVNHFFSIEKAHKELIVEAISEVESKPKPIVLENLSITCSETRDLIQQNRDLRIQIWQFLIESPFIRWDNEIKAFAEVSFLPERSLYDSVKDLCHRIFTEFKFVSNHTNINTPIKTVLKERKGVCQDFSHLAIASIRSMGFAARYVSGYLETKPPKGQKKLQGSDASHAWISVYIPNAGWCEFDPTNDIIPGERHIVTAYGRDYSDVVPLKGVIFSSGRHTLTVEVDVIPMEENEVIQ